jgi:translocation and assembly module TamB
VQTPLPVAVTSKITIHGQAEGRTLKGTVLVEDGSARLPALTNVRNLQPTGPLKDVVYVDAKGRAESERLAAEPPEEAFAIEIETKVPGPFHVRSKEVQLDLEGALTVRAKGHDVRVKGEVSSINGGRLELFGKPYEIDHVRIGFDGRRRINPSLDVKITRELDAARIGAEVTGTAKKPVLRLFSEPSIYSETQVIQAMLGGDPGAPTSDGGLDRKVTGALAGLLIGVIKNQLAPQLPIDVIKVDTGDGENGGLGSTRIELGKYITESIYVGYVHQFGQIQIGTRRLSQNQGDFEYRFKRRYALELSIGDAPAGKADLFWTLRF